MKDVHRSTHRQLLEQHFTLELYHPVYGCQPLPGGVSSAPVIEGSLKPLYYGRLGGRQKAWPQRMPYSKKIAHLNPIQIFLVTAIVFFYYLVFFICSSICEATSNIACLHLAIVSPSPQIRVAAAPLPPAGGLRPLPLPRGLPRLPGTPLPN